MPRIKQGRHSPDSRCLGMLPLLTAHIIEAWMLCRTLLDNSPAPGKLYISITSSDRIVQQNQQPKIVAQASLAHTQHLIGASLWKPLASPRSGKILFLPIRFHLSNAHNAHAMQFCIQPWQDKLLSLRFFAFGQCFCLLCSLGTLAEVRSRTPTSTATTMTTSLPMQVCILHSVYPFKIALRFWSHSD